MIIPRKLVTRCQYAPATSLGPSLPSYLTAWLCAQPIPESQNPGIRLLHVHSINHEERQGRSRGNQASLALHESDVGTKYTSPRIQARIPYATRPPPNPWLPQPPDLCLPLSKGAQGQRRRRHRAPTYITQPTKKAGNSACLPTHRPPTPYPMPSTGEPRCATRR